MKCQHCRARNENAATACAACGKPIAPRRRATAPKSARRGHAGQLAAMDTRSGTGQAPSTADDEPVNHSASSQEAGHTVPAAVDGAAQRHATDRKPTPLALAPRHMPVPLAGAQPSAAPVRKRLPMLQASLIGIGLTAALVFALSGAWRGDSRVASTVAAVGAIETPPVVESAQVKAPTPSAIPATRKPAARKQLASAPSNPEKIAKRPAKSVAGNPGKTRVESLAKAPAATHEPQDVRLASKAPAIQGRFAQCMELGSFLRREQCKWQVCNGKWGQDGCPSYSNDNGNIY